MHVHLAGNGNALDWNMFPSPSVSAFCISACSFILLEKFKLDERGVLITADVIHNFLPLVSYGRLFFLSLDTFQALGFLRFTFSTRTW